MNKERLALIVAATALICVIATSAAFTFFQLPNKNNNPSSSNPSPAVNLPSSTQSLTPDETADSFELQVKDMNQPNSNGVTFNRVDTTTTNQTVVAQLVSSYANYTKVSEAAFLGYINNYLYFSNAGASIYQGSFYAPYDGFSADVLRIGNTFYLTTNCFWDIPSTTSPISIPFQLISYSKGNGNIQLTNPTNDNLTCTVTVNGYEGPGNNGIQLGPDQTINHYFSYDANTFSGNSSKIVVEAVGTATMDPLAKSVGYGYYTITVSCTP